MHRIRAHNSTVKAGIAAPLLALLALLALLVASRQAAGDPLPACLAVAEQGTIRSTVLKTRPEPAELLARLVYAESRSTGFADDARVYRAIAWGVMNRVRLGEASSAMRRRYGDGIAGVIFRKGQFNPAVSPRSPFSRDFLCPRDPAGWGLATEAARIALRGQDNPFVQTAWEREHGLSLVVNFYYPGSSQARGPLAPWERDGELRFIGAVSVGGTALPAERVRFYRLATPPGDVGSPANIRPIAHDLQTDRDAAMNRTGTVLLEFDPRWNALGKAKKLSDGLSAAVQIGDALWVANDESLSLERLSRQPGTGDGAIRYADHRQFSLHDYLELPMPPRTESGNIEEADIEGLDHDGGYLWLVGSHSVKRAKPKAKNSVAKNVERLAEVGRDGNRFLLARIPLTADGHSLERAVGQNGHRRTAARLRGDARGNQLTEALADDPHLGPFLAIPGKDNGFDIEGLSVAGDRVFVGLRGPVLRGWAVILELALEEQDASTLTLKPIGPGGRSYRKHFLDLGGLGVRDLCARGDDLLVLAGPTLTVAGPQKVFRWPGGARLDRETLAFRKDLPTVLDIPVGAGPERAEGIASLDANGGDNGSVLVVYDPAGSRRRDESAAEADLFVPGR